jgi:hypothetical protein
LGALIGEALGAGGNLERWEKARPPQLGVGVAPQRRGIGASLVLRF